MDFCWLVYSDSDDELLGRPILELGETYLVERTRTTTIPVEAWSVRLGPSSRPFPACLSCLSWVVLLREHLLKCQAKRIRKDAMPFYAMMLGNSLQSCGLPILSRYTSVDDALPFVPTSSPVPRATVAS